MEKYLYKGKSEEEIIPQACEELNVTPDQIFYKTYEEKTGILKAKKTVVEIVKISDIGELGKSILLKLIEGMGIKGNIEMKIRENLISYEVFSNNNALLIGKKGKILESIQAYLKQVLYTKVGISTNVVIDIENYRQKQLYFLTRDIKRIARDVTLSKTEVKLDPMNSYERRLVHSVLTKFEYIETSSEGEEPNRRVVIKYKEKEK